MEPQVYLAIALPIVVFFLIRAEILNMRSQIYWLKPLATLMVITIALLSYFDPGLDQQFSLFIVIGLLFSLGGDLALMFPQNRKAFSAGLGLFLTAHIIYSASFIRLGQFSGWTFFPILIIALLGMGFFILIREKLGEMKVPVILYIIIISIMLMSASLVLGNGTVQTSMAWMILLGAILFYISDIILAANRYWQAWEYNRISLAFYYSGQLLIALSANISS